MGISFFSKSNLKTFSFGVDFDKGCRFTEIHRVKLTSRKFLQSLCNSSYIFVNVIEIHLEIMISIRIPPQKRWTSVVHYLLQVPCPHLSCEPRVVSVEKHCISLRSKHQASAIVVEGGEIESQFPGFQAQKHINRTIFASNHREQRRFSAAPLVILQVLAKPAGIKHNDLETSQEMCSSKTFFSSGLSIQTQKLQPK